MVYGSGPITKKISKKTLTKHHPGVRLEDSMREEFFNSVLKKNLMPSHECLTRKQLAPSITG
jgi:hypothetical protein